jgi:hypothetical protein
VSALIIALGERCFAVVLITALAGEAARLAREEALQLLVHFAELRLRLLRRLREAFNPAASPEDPSEVR